MTFIGQKPDYRELSEYKLAESTSALIRQTCDSMTWTRDWEWLRGAIIREADCLTATLAEGYESDYVAEWILGIGSCRSAVVMSDYIFTFLRGQGMLEEAKADPVLGRLDELMAAIMALSQKLRAELMARRGTRS